MNKVLLRCSSCGSVNSVQKEKLNAGPTCGKCRSKISYPSSPVDVTSASFQGEVIKEPGAVLVDFWSPTCGHCMQLMPVLDDIARSMAGTVKIVRINATTERQLAAQFEITGVPTLILYKGGKKIKDIAGAVPKQQLISWINAAL